MKTWMLIASSLLALLLTVPTVSAQELPIAEMREDVAYYAALYTRFKPGMEEEAKKMIDDEFWPMYKAAGVDIMPFETLTGDWDNVAFFPLAEGPGEFAWELSPTDEKLLKTFIGSGGSMEEIQEMTSRFNECIADQKVEIVMTRWNASK
ncbi:MAG TPA: hypothetical protein VKP65_01735 [Rhodothermales bacterium]|nr:hypothetical protein [Rhodothermales bacterium]